MSLPGRVIQWLGASALAYPLGLLYSIILARGLGSGARGEYAALLTLATMLAGVGSLALGTVGRAEIARDPSSFRPVHSNLVWFCAAVGVTVIAGMPMCLRLVSQVFSVKSPTLAAGIFLAVPFLVYGIYWPLLFQGAGHYKVINAVRLGKACIEPLLLVLLFMVVGKSIWSAVGTWLGVSLLVTAIALWLSVTFFGPVMAPRWHLLHAHLRHGWKLAVSGQAIAFQTQVAVLLLARFHPGAEVAFFAVATGAAAQMGILVGTLATVSSDRLAGHDSGQAVQLLMLLNRLFAMGTLAIAVPLALVGIPLMSLLYGAEFRRAGMLLWVLAGAIVASQATDVNCQYLIGQHRDTGLILKLNLANMLLGSGLCVLLIPSHGAFGAALGVSVGYLTNAVAYQAVVRSRLACRWRAIALVTSEDFGTVVRAIRQLRLRDAVT